MRIQYNFSKIQVAAALMIAVAFVFVYYALTVGPFSNLLFDISSVFVVVLVLLFLNQSQKGEMKGFWIKPSYFFILGFWAVNLQFLTDVRLGLKGADSERIIYPTILNHCLALAVVGLAAFVAGYISVKGIIHKREDSLHSKMPGKAALLSVIQLIVFALFVYNIDLVSFLSGADYGIAEHNLANYFESLLYVCNAAIVVYAVKNNNISNLRSYFKAIPALSLMVIILYILMRLMSGDRGPFIYTTLLLIFGYLYAVKRKVKLVYIFSFALAAMLFVSVIGIARSLDRSDTFLSRMIYGYDTYRTEGRFGSDSRTVFGLTEELGFSFVVNQVDVNAVVCEDAKYHYGTYQLITIANSIPFMPGFIANVLHVKPEDRGSSGFANYHFFHGYDRTWGIGTTCLGDFYLDLGVLGVLLGFLLAGILFKCLDLSIITSDSKKMSIYEVLFILLFSAKSIYMPRSVLLIDLQGFVLGLFLLLFNNMMMKGAKN